LVARNSNGQLPNISSPSAGDGGDFGMGDDDWDYDLDDGDGSRHGDDAFRRRGKVLHVVGALVVLLSF